MKYSTEGPLVVIVFQSALTITHRSRTAHIFCLCASIYRNWDSPRCLTNTCSPQFNYSTNFHYRKDEPVKWSKVASSGDVNITTTECEAYATVNQGREYEVPEHTGQQPSGPENEIPVIKCPAYVSASEQKGGRAEETEYEPV